MTISVTNLKKYSHFRLSYPESSVKEFFEYEKDLSVEEKDILLRYASLFDASVDFYSGRTTELSDQVYDLTRRNFLAEMEVDILKFIDVTDGDVSMIHDDITPFDSKIQLDGNFKESLEKELTYLSQAKEYVITPKYDGNSLIIYYKDGNLEKILTKSSDDYGFNKTDKLKNFVPLHVDPSIRSIQCEGLVSLNSDVEGSIRNKANGLVNSKYMQEEVERLLTLRAFKVNFIDKLWDYKRSIEALKSLEEIQVDGRLVFAPSVFLTEDQIPLNDKLEIEGDDPFLVDGVVVYDSFGGINAYKFYYTESEEVTIDNIDWGYTNRESYSPVAEFEPVELQGAVIQRASLNGVNMLLELQAGIGAKVKLIRANSTIPKIIETYIPSEKYNFPVCLFKDEEGNITSGCGTTLTPETSLFGNSLKCPNPDCSEKLNFRLNTLLEDTDFNQIKYKEHLVEAIEKHFNWFIDNILIIDRFNAENKLVDITKKSLAMNFLTACDNNDLESFKNSLETYFHYSDLQHEMMTLNYKAAFKALQTFINKQNII